MEDEIKLVDVSEEDHQNGSCRLGWQTPKWIKKKGMVKMKEKFYFCVFIHNKPTSTYTTL